MKTFRLESSIKDVKTFNFWQSLVAEFLGTFILVFVGFGTAYNNMNPVKLGLGFGLAGAVAIVCIGPISGAHINPAVSCGLLVARQISLIRYIFYTIFQIIGATAGFGLISGVSSGEVLYKSYYKINFTSSPSLGEARIDEVIHRVTNPYLKIICELVITFVLVFTVMRLCVEKRRSPTEKGIAPLFIGLSITAGVYCGMNISGGSMNPAASLGKYFFKGGTTIMTHIIGPLLGGALAGVSQQMFFTSDLSMSHIKSYLFDSEFEDHSDNYEPSSSRHDHVLSDNL
uniref:Aquaporin n=1 Tax=Dugesia japonica TaxID=6161 RepID=A0A0G4DCR1_DUGJA|nr:aquaporin [Dugesia japonica]